MASVVNPPIPYIGGIPGGLQDGTHIIINGTVAHHQHMFSINLACGTNLNPRSDTALHFNVRLNENCIVRNSMEHGGWGGEERHGGMPLRRGVPFQVEIVSQHNQFKIKIDGRHFADFHHRIPKHRVNTLTVEGDVFINSIRFQGGGAHGHHHQGSAGGYIGETIAGIAGAIFGGGKTQPAARAHHHHGHHHGHGHPAAPSYPTGTAYPPPPAGGAGQPMYNPPVPLTVGIPGGMFPGKMVFISGVPHPNPTRFTVNLQCGAYEHADVGLHIDVRFQVGGDCNVVLRNHRQGGNWGAEERQATYFPFMRNANFDMIIMAESSCFKVAVNNNHLLEFYHRLQPISRIDHLKVSGDLRLTQVRFQ